MGRHRCVPLLAILARPDCAHGVRSWTARCWDGGGRRSKIVVRLGFGFVTLEGQSFGPVYLAPAQAGELRVALRQATLELGRLGGKRLPARPTTVSSDVRPGLRTRVTLRARVPRPTVADIMARLRITVSMPAIDATATAAAAAAEEVWPSDDTPTASIPDPRSATPVATTMPLDVISAPS